MISPKVHKYEQDGILVWRLSGDWVRDLPPKIRATALASLEDEVESGVVVDISDVGYMDNWGVCLVCDVLEEASPRAAWVVGTLQVRIAGDVERDLKLRELTLSRFQHLLLAVQKVKDCCKRD